MQKFKPLKYQQALSEKEKQSTKRKGEQSGSKHTSSQTEEMLGFVCCLSHQTTSGFSRVLFV